MNTEIEKFTRFVAQEMAKPNSETTSLSVPVELLHQILSERDGALFAATSHLRTVEQQRKIIEGMPGKGGEYAELIERLTDYANEPGYSHCDYADTMKQAAAALAARPAAAPQQAVSVLDGWQLVPVQPTAAMADAGATTDSERESVWAAYLAAAPTPPTATPAPTLTDAEIYEAYAALELPHVPVMWTAVLGTVRAIAAHLTTAAPAAKGE